MLHHARTLATALILLTSCFAPVTHAATSPDKLLESQQEPVAKPMKKKEPMAGGMKKDGMMKEDVSKAVEKWSAEMDEKMKREKMK